MFKKHDDSDPRHGSIDDPFQEATVPALDLFLVTTDAPSIVNTKLPRVRKGRRGTFPRLATNMRILNSSSATKLHHSRSSPSLDREGEDGVTTSSGTIGTVPLSLELSIDAILLAW